MAEKSPRMHPPPRHVLCLLGHWSSFDPLEACLPAGFSLDREYSVLEPDDRMVGSFEVSEDGARPSMQPSDWEAVREHRAVAYVLSPPMERERSCDISGEALSFLARALQDGAVAAKGESSGIAHGRERWLELARQAAQPDPHTRRGTLYFSWVRRPLQSDDLLYSCGMHLLGEPDLELPASLGVAEALEWMDLLGLYLVADRPGEMRTGEGFRLREDGPRRTVRRLQCRRYDPEEFFFNPYGYVRLED